MILLKLLSWQYFRAHILRSSLTSAGIVLGVAVFVGMHTANQAVLSAFSSTVDRIAGKTELQVTAGDAGFGEEILEKVQAAASVRVAVPVIEAVVDSGIPGQGSLLVLGIDMTGDRSLREYDLEHGDETEIDDPLIFLAQPDSLLLSKEFAARNNIVSGRKLTLGTAEGPRNFTVRGLMKSADLTSAFNGNIAVMDIYAAQRMFGRGRTFDRIDLALQPGVMMEQGRHELGTTLGPAFEVQTPSGRGQQFEALLAGYTLMMDIASAFALVIGMFIIYNSFSIAVTQRRTEIAIARALGATRNQIRWLFLGEGATMGFLGSAAGLAIGIVAAQSLSAWVSNLVANVYGIAQQVDDVVFEPRTLGIAFVIGVATSVIAATLPANDAASIDPVLALQKGRQQQLPAGQTQWRLRVTAVLMLLATACGLWSASRSVFYLGYVSVVLAALAIAPVVALWLARALRPLLRWIRPVEGPLAADGLIQAPRRTSGSVVALMLSIALVVAFAGMGQAMYRSILAWMNTTLDPDLFVLPTPSIDVQTTRFPSSMGAELMALPGVARVQSVRNTRVTFGGVPIMVVAVDVKNVSETSHLPPVAGDAEEMYRAAAAGRGVMVSDNLAQLQGLSLGQTVDVSAPHGNLHLPIVGIIVDYTDQQGVIVVDRALFDRHWRDDTVNTFRVYVSAGTAVSEVRQRILDLYSGRRQVFALTNGEFKDYVFKVASQWVNLTSIQVLVAVLVAILGIVNALTVSIIDRRREFGVLRAVGARQTQIRWTVWLEALTVALVGLVLGCVLGALNLGYVLDMVRRDIAGMRVSYEFPWRLLLTLVPSILAAAFVAALWPSRAAVRGSLVEALEYE